MSLWPWHWHIPVWPGDHIPVVGNTKSCTPNAMCWEEHIPAFLGCPHQECTIWICPPGGRSDRPTPRVTWQLVKTALFKILEDMGHRNNRTCSRLEGTSRHDREIQCMFLDGAQDRKGKKESVETAGKFWMASLDWKVVLWKCWLFDLEACVVVL